MPDLHEAARRRRAVEAAVEAAEDALLHLADVADDDPDLARLLGDHAVPLAEELAERADRVRAEHAQTHRRWVDRGISRLIEETSAADVTVDLDTDRDHGPQGTLFDN